MSKTEVYSWRLPTELKTELEAVARTEKTSLSALIAKVMRGWLDERRPSTDEEKAERARINRVLGEIVRDARARDAGGAPTPSATNENVRKAFARKLAKDRERRRDPG